MPLTLAHPAAMLPLRRAGLPMSALVLGSMVPDIPLFLGLRQAYGLTHGLVGVVTVDVLAVVIGLALWFGLLRDALVDLSPTSVRERLAARANLSRTAWILTLPAAVIGATSHVIWDAFTHSGAWGTDRVTWLRDEHAGLSGHQWAQYVSGVLGVGVVGAYAVAELRRLPVLRQQAEPSALGRWALPAVIGSTGLVGLVVAAAHTSRGLHVMAYDAVVSSIACAVVLTVTVCVAWRVRA